MNRVYLFNQCRFIPSDGVLINSDSEEIQLSTSQTKLLVILLTKSQQTIEKSYLISSVYGQSGSEAKLIQDVSKLRKAVNDNSVAPEIITSHPGKGFCLTSDVEIEELEIDHEPEVEMTDPPKLKNKKLFLSTLAVSLLITIIVATHYLFPNHNPSQQSLYGSNSAPIANQDKSLYLYRLYQQDNPEQFHLYIANQLIINPLPEQLIQLTDTGNAHYAIWADKKIIAVVTENGLCQVVALERKDDAVNKSPLNDCKFGDNTKIKWNTATQKTEQFR